MKYIKGKGILVGTYSEQDLQMEKDKVDVQKMKEQTGLSYTNQDIITKDGKTYLKLYVCKQRDLKV